MKLSAAIILVVLLCGLAVVVSGCSAPSGKVVGVTDTNAERQNRLTEVHNTGWREFVDDWDIFWLQEKPLRLSEYPIR
jgi:hypothetical protein